jgi:hypothetical protein
VHLQRGIAFVELFQQRRLGDAVDDGLRAGDPDDTGDLGRGAGQLLLELRHRGLDTLGMGQQRLAELGQAVAAGLTLHQRQAEALFQLRQSPLHGRLVQPQGAARRQRAAVACHGQQMPEIVPVEVLGGMRHCGSRSADLRLTPREPDPRLRAMIASGTEFKAAVRSHWDAAAAGWDKHTPALHAWLRQPPTP